MGLKGGVKPWLMTTFQGTGVFRAYHALTHVAPTIGNTPRERVAAAVDGNVALMRIPMSVRTLREFVYCFVAQFMKVVQASHVNVLVFDEPENLTDAKRAEQFARDSAGKARQPTASEDFEGAPPKGDDYLLETLEQVDNVHDIIPHRPAKARFFDEVIRQAYPIIMRKIQADPFLHGTVFIVDGIDPLGATRPIGQQRVPSVWGAEGCALVPEFQRELPIGEGDLKLSWVQQRVRDLVQQGALDTRLHMTITIDTDSFAIELCDAARRAVEGYGNGVIGVLCIPDNSRAAVALLPGDHDETMGTPYLVCNYEGLQRRIQDYVWNAALIAGHPPPTAEQKRLCTSLIAAGWALTGSDFVKLNGMKPDTVMSCIGDLLSIDPNFIEPMRHAWSGERSDVMKLVPVLSSLARMCSRGYALQSGAKKALVENMDRANKSDLARGAWTIAYWNGNEQMGDLHEFGFPVVSGVVASLS